MIEKYKGCRGFSSKNIQMIICPRCEEKGKLKLRKTRTWEGKEYVYYVVDHCIYVNGKKKWTKSCHMKKEYVERVEDLIGK